MDIYLFREGTFYKSWEKLGAHQGEKDGVKGVWFNVWAPNAQYLSVIGDFNQWNKGADQMNPLGHSGIWQCFIPEISKGAIYKYYIESAKSLYSNEKLDPYGFYFEVRPKSASIVWDIDGYDWNDQEWMEKRIHSNKCNCPVSIYEVHLGSWMRVPEEENRWLSYREIAPKLAEYVKEMGFTHVEFLPVSEHPLDASWGYQTLGYFAPTSRFGTPQDFMYLVDLLHQNNIGVIIDWVPAHFPKDGHGLAYFDGTFLYEHLDPRLREHKDWGTNVFNYGRTEVANFLISNALFWLEIYHIDGLRVDAVASMLYLDYSRKDGEWYPNKFGGRENLEAIDFIKRFNEIVFQYYPECMTYAEESTSWAMVSRPTYLGGLGFGFKWNMGWMHDTLLYFSKEPIYRKYHHNTLTFSMIYAFHENFVLPFSHDEVVHGKGSLISKMPGDNWQKFANLRLLFGYMFTHVGKKLIFMGCEIGQWHEWYHEESVHWHLLEEEKHIKLKKWVSKLNLFYKENPALYLYDFDYRGFEWIDCNDSEQSILLYIRKGENTNDILVCAANFTPVPRHNYKIGVTLEGKWEEVLNSDLGEFGGSNIKNHQFIEAEKKAMHGRDFCLYVTLPPLSIVVFKPVR
jgi:1,4-alpha-glucan branching enzyme